VKVLEVIKDCETNYSPLMTSQSHTQIHMILYRDYMVDTYLNDWPPHNHPVNLRCVLRGIKTKAFHYEIYVHMYSLLLLLLLCLLCVSVYIYQMEMECVYSSHSHCRLPSKLPPREDLLPHLYFRYLLPFL